MAQQNHLIRIPALSSDGTIIIPGFDTHRTITCRSGEKGPWSCFDYNSDMHLATLAQMIFAFYGTNDQGKFVSPAYRDSVTPNKAEWTSTFITNRKAKKNAKLVGDYTPIMVIHYDGTRDRIVHDDRTGWHIEYDSAHAFERLVPRSGYATKFDNETGMPVTTTTDLRYAAEVVGGEPPYFVYNFPEGQFLRSVYRSSWPDEKKRFCVDMTFGVETRYKNLGGRLCTVHDTPGAFVTFAAEV